MELKVNGFEAGKSITRGTEKGGPLVMDLARLKSLRTPPYKQQIY
jgi:hypothetical protein